MLRPALEGAKRGEGVVPSADAAHFSFGPMLGFVWCLARMFVKAPASRQRYSVLAAIDPLTTGCVARATTGKVDRYEFMGPLKDVRRRYPEGRVTAVRDNARYRKCWWAKTSAGMTGIELVDLPPDSPNLTVIERLWKFVRSKVPAARAYSDFESFRAAIDGAMAGTATVHKEALSTLITGEFQSFTNVPTIAA